MQIIRALALLALAPGCVQSASAQIKVGHTMQAKGSFEVKMGVADVADPAKAAGLGAMSIDKIWHGELEGTSQGEMLHASEASTGAMAYVALERVTGKLHGRAGTFLFTHGAAMLKSDPTGASLVITVVPQSGTGELAGLTGSLQVVIDSKGGHTYVFDYTLPEVK